MGWIWYVVTGAVGLFCIWAYIRRNMSLNHALEALAEIRGLATYAANAMEDGRISAGERDEIIKRVLEVAKRFM